MHTQMYIAVIGPGDAALPHLLLAERVGTLLARAGVVVVSGGLGGVMRASCKGAMNEGGMTLGLLPGVDRSQANEFLTVSVPTGLAEARNALVVAAADGVIAIGMGWGTLSEIALAMRAEKPLVSLGGWRVSGPDGSQSLIPEFADPDHATQSVLARVQSRAK